MDPPAMLNDGSYNFSEIWQFPVTGNGRGHFGQSLGSQFGDNDPMNLERPGFLSGGDGGGRKRRGGLEDDSSKVVLCSSNGNGVDDCDSKRLKTPGNRDENDETNTETEGKNVEQKAEPPKQDYIHVRARRGQATDSHSLAERARREKISERMKILQDLVPGCNKVIGKALVLDEIINYIQSLQRQVEFLSMKLEAVNTRMSPGIEPFPSKDFGQQAFDAMGMAFGSQGTRDYSRGASPEWLHMQVGGGFERT